VRGWTGWSRRCGRARAGYWWSAVSPGWARRRCWTTWPGTRRDAGWCAPPGCRRRWSSHSPGCTSCARRCWISSAGPRCPQREALRTAFGLSAGAAPSRFFIDLAVLDLLSAVAGERALVCVVDDEQWLDGVSAQVLGFVARRLAAEPVGLVFAARDPSEELAGLPQLTVEGLPERDARALLDSVLTGPVDARMRERFIAE